MAAAKNIAIGCIAAVVLAGVIVACGVGGIFWLGLTGVAEKTEQEGVEFGRKTDQLGCRVESLRRLHTAIRDRDLLKRRQVQMFAYGCFQSCRATPGFCADAPKEDAFFAVQAWAREQCQREGLGNDDACVDVFKEFSDSCLGKTKRK